MRISAMTLLALSVAALAGCGGVVSSCSRAAVKIGSSSAGKGTAAVGTEEGLRGLGVTGMHGLEQGAAKGAAGRAAIEAETGARPGVMLQAPDDAARAADDAAAAQQGGEHSSFANEIGPDVLQQGVEGYLNSPSGSDDDRR